MNTSAVRANANSNGDGRAPEEPPLVRPLVGKLQRPGGRSPRQRRRDRRGHRPEVPSNTTLDYATADGTAREDYDYIMASGTLSFAAGESAKQVGVLLVNDAHGEQDEAFGYLRRNPNDPPDTGFSGFNF
jgi:hypothetical protein